MNEEISITPFFSDEELTALALDADPHPDIDPRAAPWRPVANAVTGLLPEWYMPAVSGSRRGPGARVAVGVIVAGFVLINALGLCITYGYISLA